MTGKHSSYNFSWVQKLNISLCHENLDLKSALNILLESSPIPDLTLSMILSSQVFANSFKHNYAQFLKVSSFLDVEKYDPIVIFSVAHCLDMPQNIYDKIIDTCV